MRLVRNIRCNLLFFIICWGAASHGILQSGEKDALAELLLTFPRLSSIPTSEFVVDNHVDYGRSWTNNFDSLCLGSDGYEYYGLFCSGGHIAGIMLTQAWEPGISRNFSSISGLAFLKNVTVKHPVLSNPLSTVMSNLALTLANTLPIERMICQLCPPFGNGSFSVPSALQDLDGILSPDFDLTPFENLRSLRAVIASISPPSKLGYGIWPSTLEYLQLEGGIPINELLELASNLTNIKSIDVLSYADTNEAGEGTLVSESLEYLRFKLSSYPDFYTLTVNSSSLKIAAFTTAGSPLVLNTPNLQQLMNYEYNGFPTGFTELYHLEELTMAMFNVSAAEFPNLNFAPNLTSLWFNFWIVEPSDFSLVLCMIASNNPKLSTLHLSPVAANTGTLFELPACLRAASQLTSLDLSNPPDYPLHAASIFAALPPSIEYLNLYLNLDIDTNIYNFTQFRQLKQLQVNNDHFMGEMKNDFFSFFPNLERLIIISNNVNGTIPSIGWANLRSIELSCKVNQWTGLDSAPFLRYMSISSDALETIPNDVYLVNLVELEYLTVFPSASVSIPTPSFWTRLPKLIELSMYQANFSGPITSSIAAPRLRTVNLNSNSICGSLPDIDIPMTLDSLYFPNNRFSGSIPLSWEANLTVQSSIDLSSNLLSGTVPYDFLSKKMPNLGSVNLGDNYFSGPVWNLSQNYPSGSLALSYNNFNICDSPPLLPFRSINSCTSNNVSACPASGSECLSSWQTSCRYFYCTEGTVRVPPVEECHAPPPYTPPYSPPTMPVFEMGPQCSPPGPPGFECVNGQWVSNGSVSIPSTTLLPPNGGIIVVNGNLSTNGSLTFDGIGTTIVVEGCVETLPTEVIIIIKGDENLKTTNLLTQKGAQCSSDLRSIPVSLTQPKNNCKQVKSSTKESTRSSLIVVFDLDSHKCNIKWIILGSVLGGIVILATVGFAILYNLSPRFRSFIRSCQVK